MLAESGYKVLCFDVSSPNLDALRRLYADLVESGAMRPILADITQVPLNPKSLDGAVCMEVLEHVEDDQRALTEMARVLRPGAIFLVSAPNRIAPKPLIERLGLESVHDRAGVERHVRPGYTERELVRLVESAGFRVERVFGVGGSFFRAASGVVSLAHLVFRRLRGQSTWTWADVEEDANSLLLRLYARIFPVFLFLARIGSQGRASDRSTLLVTAVKAE